MRMRAGLLASLLSSLSLGLGCSDDAAKPAPEEQPPLEGFPDPADLPASDELPDPFVMFSDGSTIDDAEGWRERRRPELITLFSHYVYGFSPEAPASVTVVETLAHDDFFGGAVKYRELEVSFGDAPVATVALFLPAEGSPPAVFLGLNKCGNHTVVDDERVTVSGAWVDVDACGSPPDNRAARASSWPVQEIVDRGYALATVHESDFDPDDPLDTRMDGIHPFFSVDVDEELAWGTVAAWSWGLSRVVDALEQRSDVDASRIATVGHSRRGKAALWAAALDERIAMTIPHQSGTAGVTLSRSYGGESVFWITTLFPHWFDGLFASFADNEPKLPIDQHLLVALVAPRPLLATDGADDHWADPPGARLSLEAADPVYELLGDPGLVVAADGDVETDATLVHRIRPGDHALLASDWELFMAFADHHF